MKPEEFEGYIVPPLCDIQEALNGNVNQSDLCSKTNELCLYIEDLDCKNCLFSNSHCPVSIFEHWRNQKKEENE